MNVVESILSTALAMMIVAGYMHVATQQIHVRDADRLLEDVRVFQDALIRHQQSNPQDGVEGWFEPQYQVPGDATTPLVWREVADLDARQSRHSSAVPANRRRRQAPRPEMGAWR